MQTVLTQICCEKFEFCLQKWFCPLTSLTPAPCRQYSDLLVVMWSSADVLEDESSPWLSRSLSLSSMEANTALSIQTDTQQNTEHGLLWHPLVPGHPIESTSCCVPPSGTWDAILLLDFLRVVAAAFTVFCEFISAVHVNSVLKSRDAWSVEWPWTQAEPAVTKVFSGSLIKCCTPSSYHTVHCSHCTYGRNT